MDFALTDDQELLRDTARNLLARECPTSLLRAHIDDPGVAAPLWERLREFCGLGAGSAVDLCLFLEQTGYVAAPGQFFATVALFAPMLEAAESDLLEKVLAGEVTGTVALAGLDGVWRPGGEATKTFVPEADRVDHIAVVGAGPTITVVDRLPTRLVGTVDTSRRLFDVDTTTVVAGGRPIAPEAVELVTDRATVGLAAELVGTCRRLFDMALGYAKERVQFDRPIGSFQAIQHKLADMALDLERAWAAVYYAAMTLDAQDSERHRAAHVAKATAGEAARRIGKDSAQIHGGIGYTWEHDLHLFLRRAFASEAWLGTTDWHHDRLAELIV
jgi:alkylation response protein AidB-like acyl-CoA dehydrogenase